ncbi:MULTISPECIES: DUF1003 domain-containing protein [unclassified Cryobacterium]|uniref:DUF1003 domain-containing protein n=1 Tax=unclassified Cryobacterium TaxID=2649013 RepID=UPI002AB387B2|nr:MULTISPECIES: DUF1003 domain-containing protein [Cryobacterium]MDY7526328.1 DUF1003 domain-containing protein [Cryobacterium sp. 10C2]MDY7557866.1 DUF1003 domain-containing protein [Cryobacterium sp. 10C3]MEB0203636.1 DUF1003 domain-containing protein [Cryobacterium sp. 5I3]MEB0288587.1 DUF1003 domain-containing protein [Cryobacterium sp. 10S3]MEB0292428.1 DUF1003 domain-containing protein [Cryobacterium sp. 10C2]
MDHTRELRPSKRTAPTDAAAASENEHLGLNARLGLFLTSKVGSMWSVYITIVFVFVWIVLASVGPLHKTDPYPFPFLLFLGNLVQLVLVFVILVGQGVLGRSSDHRSERTFRDAETILSEVLTLHSHLVEQDRILNKGVDLVKSSAHPRVKERETITPTTVGEQYVGLNGRIAAAITRAVSTMWAFYFAVFFQFGWIGLALTGIITFDPYPFAFLLFISSLLQLVFMFVIMVGQDVLGRAGTQRAEQTYLDAEAVVHECRRLQRHLTQQDKAIVAICNYIESEAPQDHPIRQTLPTVTF